MLAILYALPALAHANSPSQTIDCTRREAQRKHTQLCREVIDPMKAKRGILANLNCQGSFEDGYAIGICERVNLKDQKRLKAMSRTLKKEI